MPDRRLKSVNLNLEYAIIKGGQRFDPYQKATKLPVLMPLVIEEQNKLIDMADSLALGLQKISNKSYILFVVENKLPINLDFLDDVVQGAFKVTFTIEEMGREEPYKDTTYYPLKDTKMRSTISTSGTIKWHLVLKQEGEFFQLIYTEDQGAGEISECERLKCSTTNDEATRQLCARIEGCYSQV